MLLGITQGYGTVSTDALPVVAGVLPLDLELIVLARVGREKVAERTGNEMAESVAKRINRVKAEMTLL